MLVVLAALCAESPALAGSGDRARPPPLTSPRPPAVVIEAEGIIAPTASMRSFAGSSVALMGDVALVGVPGVTGAGSGSVYVYRRFGRAWGATPEQTLSNPDTMAGTGDNFGATIAVANGFAVIGAPGDGSSDQGIAYLFSYDDTAALGSRWSHVALGLPRPAGGPNLLGSSVAISADWVVVGAPDNGMSGTVGTAYVYAAPFTSSAVALPIPAAGGDDLVGTSVAVSGNTVLVGAPGYDDPGTDSGTVFAFDYVAPTWSAAGRLPTDSAGRADFGASVALALGGTRALVGSPYDSVAGSNAGAVFVFERASAAAAWPATGRRVTVMEPHASDYFGQTVAMTDTHAVVGAPLDEEPGEPEGEIDGNFGSAYLLSGPTLAETARFRVSARSPRDHLGQAVAIDGDTVLAGAPESRTLMMVGFVASFRTPRPTGSECSVAGECESGVCYSLGATGVCCAETCAGECEACSATTGMCEAANAGASCGAGGACGMGTCAGRACSTPGCDGGPPDAGPVPLDGPGVDAPVGPRRPVHISGCRCGVGAPSASPGALVLVLVGALAMAARRRR